MKLTDAMALGYQEVDWTVGVLENRTNQRVEGAPRKGCALGLAAIGLGGRFGHYAHDMKLNGSFPADDQETRKLWHLVVVLNNTAESYEDAVMRLKEHGLDQVEVEL